MHSLRNNSPKLLVKISCVQQRECVWIWSHAKSSLRFISRTNEKSSSERKKRQHTQYFRYHKNHNNDVSTLSLGIESGKLLRMSFNFSRFPHHELIISLLTHTHIHTLKKKIIKWGETIAGALRKMWKPCFILFRRFFHVLPHRFSSSLSFSARPLPGVQLERTSTVTCEQAGAGPTRCCVSAVYSVQLWVRQRQKCVNEGER